MPSWSLADIVWFVFCTEWFLHLCPQLSRLGCASKRSYFPFIHASLYAQAMLFVLLPVHERCRSLFPIPQGGRWGRANVVQAEAWSLGQKEIISSKSKAINLLRHPPVCIADLPKGPCKILLCTGAATWPVMNYDNLFFKVGSFWSLLPSFSTI